MFWPRLIVETPFNLIYGNHNMDVTECQHFLMFIKIIVDK
nr:MAG TPA: hypothetical protein [Caudoviricetes sp.]